MPILNSIRRRLIEHFATLVNELHIGSDGTTFAFNTDIQEVYLQYRDPTTGEFVPVYRADITNITKNAQNEVRFSFLLEVE